MLVVCSLVLVWRENTMYRTFDGSDWRLIKKLKPEEKLLYVYLRTSNHSHLSGLYSLPVPFISYETGLSPDLVEGSLRVLIEAGFISYDFEDEIVFVRGMFGRNNRKGISKTILTNTREHLAGLNGSPLVKEFISELEALGHGASIPQLIPYLKGYPGGIDRASIGPRTGEERRERGEEKKRRGGGEAEPRSKQRDEELFFEGTFFDASEEMLSTLLGDLSLVRDLGQEWLKSFLNNLDASCEDREKFSRDAKGRLLDPEGIILRGLQEKEKQIRQANKGKVSKFTKKIGNGGRG